jgi:hypothetical protein
VEVEEGVDAGRVNEMMREDAEGFRERGKVAFCVDGEWDTSMGCSSKVIYLISC